MILNSQIWQATISEAKALSAGKPALLRAIDRAAYEIEHSKYWSFDGQTLRIQSTTSRKPYAVDDAHACEAQSKTCKHHVARRLMLRYTQALGTASSATVSTGESVGAAAAAGLPSTRLTGKPVSRSTGLLVNQSTSHPVNRSLLVEASKAVMAGRTSRGDSYNGIDI